MKIIYVAFNDWTKQQRELIKSYGISVDEGYSRIDIEENRQNLKLLELLDEWKVQKFVGTEYDKKDFLMSSLFAYVATWIMDTLNQKINLDIAK